MIPLWLLGNWKWLVPTVVATGLGLALVVTKLQLADLRVAVERQKTEAEHLRATIIERNAAQAAADAEFSRNLDLEKARADREIATAAAGYERDYADRLRRIAASRPRCGSTTTTATADTGGVAVDTAGSRDRLLEEAGRGFREVGEGAAKLAATVKTCVEWAATVGR